MAYIRVVSVNTVGGTMSQHYGLPHVYKLFFCQTVCLAGRLTPM